ncbi:glycosyltransferase family 2 protein [Aquicoccus sp.]|uniref:glycosyltransferase family 2 protein n=1 Tax=Aquicoccus sp. TaxID=2055851 RepID=UPI0035636A69
MTRRIAISIINYRTASMTVDCVRSVLSDIGDLDAHVVVVDNASGDGSADHIAGWIAEQPAGTPVTLVRSASNTGFSGGHNQGMTAVAADHYLLLNSDALLRPGFLRTVLSAAEANPQAGLIVPQIETEEGAVQVNCFRFHSPRSELIRGANSGPVTRLFQRHVVALQPPADPAAIEWASFACILLRARMTAEIGPMDEGYFLYFEDAEYCLRARRAGWGIVQEPRAVAVHFRGGSGPVKALEKARHRLPPYFYSSRTRFFRQAHGPTGPVLANLMWTAGRGIAQLRRLTGRDVPPAIEAEARDIWTGTLQPLSPHRAPEA